MFNKIILRQNPFEIYNERKERMKLVSIAPLIFLLGLSIIYSTVLYIDKGIVFDFHKIFYSFWISLFWFLTIGYLIRQNRIKEFLKNPSTLFRFLFDLPILLLGLTWVVYCYYVIDIFEYPFFATFYVLSVYSASKMVKVPIYSFATNVIGILLILVFYFHQQHWFSQNQFFTLKDILETFCALYLGLYFSEIQILFINFINLIMKFIQYIVSKLLEEP